MKKPLPAILASFLYLFPPAACSKPDQSDKPAKPVQSARECPKGKGNLSQLEKELAGYGFKLYSRSAAPDKAKIILVGYDPLNNPQKPEPKLAPVPKLASFLARYVQDNDTVLVEGQQKGEDLRAKAADIPALRCLRGQNIKAYGATHDVKWYKEFLNDLGVFDPIEEQHTALTGVMRARVQNSRRTQEEEYSKLLRAYVKQQGEQQEGKKLRGKVYAVIDYEYVTNGRFTLNLKRDGIAFVAVSTPHKKLEQIIAKGVRSVVLTVPTEKGKVTLPFRYFAIGGAPLTLPEAIVINKGEVEYSGDEKEKYTSNKGEEVSLSPGKKYILLEKKIVDIYE